MKRVVAMLWLAVAGLAACTRQSSHTDGPPAPRGKTMEDYLRRPAPPERTPPPDMRTQDSMRLHAIDVGQGAATLLEFPCGAVLIDTGGEANEQYDSEKALLAYLDAFFARRRDLARTFDLLVITHPHIDHTRGLVKVLERYRVKNVVDNGDVRRDLGGEPQLALHAWLARHKKVGHIDLARSDIDPAEGLAGPVIDPIKPCKASQVDPVLRALWSGDVGREEIGQNPNNDSVVLRVDFGEASILAPGDLEVLAIARLVKMYENNAALLDTDVFLVPHHGSRNSSTLDLIRRVSPEIAIISAGPYERYLQTEEEYTARAFGHPHEISVGHLLDPKGGVTGRRTARKVHVGKRGRWKETPSEFNERTIEQAIYSTGWDGDIVVTANANGWLEVETSKK